MRPATCLFISICVSLVARRGISCRAPDSPAPFHTAPFTTDGFAGNIQLL
jgi:hypothetical protein